MTQTIAIGLIAVSLQSAPGDTWVIRRGIARIRKGPKPFHATVARAKRNTHIKVTGKDTRGRWLMTSGIVALADDGRTAIVPFGDPDGDQEVTEGWIPKLAVRRLRTAQTDSTADRFTVADVRAMRISAGASIRGISDAASQLIRIRGLDAELAQWITSEKFTAEAYETFRGLRNPEENGREVAVPGEEALLELDPDVMEKVGQIAATQMARELKKTIVKDKELDEYVNQVATLIGEFSSRYDLLYRVVVVNDQAANSYSQPGGYIAVTTGLLDLCEDESQLAAVLAHEIAHISRDHGLRDRENTAKEIGIDIRGAEARMDEAIEKAFGRKPQASQMLVVAELNRMLDWFRSVTISKKRRTEEERDADRYAVAYLARCGYDPQSLARVVELLGRTSSALRNMNMTCHDAPDVRLGYIKEAIGALALTSLPPNEELTRLHRACYDAKVKRRLPELRGKQSQSQPQPQTDQGAKGKAPAWAQFRKTNPFGELEDVIRRKTFGLK